MDMSIRITGNGTSFYHCVSRVVDRRFVFQADEKEVFRSILRKLEAFTGVKVVTYCVMGNHFHLLLKVPDQETMPRLDAERLLELLPLLYDKATVETISHELELARRSGDVTYEKALLERYEKRRGNLSVFVKELKQRVSIFMNKRLGRTGTLWEGRFRSILVEGGESALLAVAAYIDLNPVRAGLVDHPEDYRWSGYGEANGTGKGSRKARAGLASIQREALENPDSARPWAEVQERYRHLLYLTGAEERDHSGAVSRRGFSQEEVSEVVNAATPLPLSEVLRRKVRYFCDGAVLGSAGFVEEVFDGLRASGRISTSRKSGARRLRGGDWGELRVLRDLQVRVFDPPFE
jgi:putative transposase